MPSGTDIGYLIYLDDDTIPLAASLTMGKHLDNDIVIPGEDVSDYHLRVELSERGPVFIPLGESTINVNGHEHARPIQVIIGDVIGVGQTTLQVSVEQEHAPEADRWSLHASDGALHIDLAGDLTVGRTDTSDLVLRNEHISRNHARFVEKNRVVWVQDLNSANGTTINGTPIIGGVRLFHGDTVAFDAMEFQLIGEGQDLTPTQAADEPLTSVTIAPPKTDAAETTEFTQVDDAQLDLQPLSPPSNETGAFLFGISEPEEGTTLRLTVGRNLIGRADSCHLTIADKTVSAEHAEIVIRPEGVTITNLMSKNGTQVNRDEISSSELHDGDVIRLGRVNFMFKNVPPSVKNHPRLGKLQLGILLATLALAITLIATFLL